MNLFSVDVLPPRCGVEAAMETDEYGHVIGACFRAYEQPRYSRGRFRARTYAWSGRFAFSGDDNPIRLRWADLVARGPDRGEEPGVARGGADA